LGLRGAPNMVFRPMAQPTAYDRLFNFANYQAENPATPLPATRLDQEFAAVKLTLDEIRQNLAVIQRDDTAIANRSVGYDQFKTEIEIGVNPPSTWATATNYVVRDTVFRSQKFYICLESHVSGTFSTDLAADKWEEVADFTAAQTATLVTYDNSTSGLTAENMQDAMDELVASVNVTSVFGRSGAVTAAASDYDADQVDFDPADTDNTDATDLQEAIEDLDTAITGKAASTHTHGQSDITGLVAALSGKVATSRSVSAAGLATGGGNFTADRTITVTEASKAEMEAGTASTVVVTPRRVISSDGVAKASVSFNATSAHINAGHNVSSVTINSPGNFTINFSTAMSSVNYVVSITPYLSGTTRLFPYLISKATGSVRVGVVDTAGNSAVVTSMDVLVFGDQ